MSFSHRCYESTQSNEHKHPLSARINSRPHIYNDGPKPYCSPIVVVVCTHSPPANIVTYNNICERNLEVPRYVFNIGSYPHEKIVIGGGAGLYTRVTGI